MEFLPTVSAEFEPDPIEPGQVVSGEPEAATLMLSNEDETGECSGLWKLTPGVVRDVEVKERSLILAGYGWVEFENGTRTELMPGVVLTFAGGEKTVWTIEKTLFKAFWLAGEA